MDTLNARGRRLLVALPTMFTAQGDLDLTATAQVGKLVERSRADGAFVAGTTGEFLALSDDERQRVFYTQRKALGGKRLIAHIGAGSARQAVALMEQALAAGITEFAALTPYYLPGTPDSTFRHFQAISEAAAGRARVYVYLFEARTTTRVTPEALAKIATLPGIVGVKISGCDLPTVLAYRAATPASFEVFTGNDADFPLAEANGIDGVVSGVASCFPATFDAMIDALDSGDASAIAAAHDDVLETVQLIAGDIARIKAALAAHGIGTPAVRMAIEQPLAEVAAMIDAAVARHEAASYVGA
jgi:4-hydroxy-tetrahydrodipicolinate synthase